MDRIHLSIWFTVCVVSAGVVCPAAAEEIIDGQTHWVHDPELIACGEYFYAFSTGNGEPIEMRRSRNLHNWDDLGGAIYELPAWVQSQHPPVEICWAPGAIYHNGKYYLHYSASSYFGQNISSIGLLSNVTLDPGDPDYAWVDEGPIISSTTGDSYNAIDGVFVKDQGGQLWLAFGSFWSGIKLTPLDSATLKPTTTPATLYSIAARSGSTTAIEAPYIVWRNGYYYLFVNWDSCCQGTSSTYNIRVGRSTSITGPYRDQNGVSMYYGGGTLVLGSGDRWIGPGHASIVSLDGQDFFSFHAYDALNNGRHVLRVHYLEWDGAGWPVVGEAVAPAAGETVGYWNFEDGTPGALLNDTGLYGQVGTVDQSGNDFHLYAWSAADSPVFSQEGETPTGTGLAARFDGDQDGYTRDAFIHRWSPAAWTIELSVKLDSLAGWQTMIGRDGSSQGEDESDFYFQNNGTNNRFRVNFDTVGGQRYILDANFTPVAGQWYSLAAVSDGQTLRMYADQMDGAGFGLVGTLALNAANDNAPAASNANWTFGRGWFRGGYVDYIRGCLDEIRFTDRALLPTEFLGYNALVISESGGATAVSEEGPTWDSFGVRLNHHATWPGLSDDVIVTLSTDGQVTVVPEQLVFTSANWQTEQAVMVTAVDDGILEDDPHTGRIQFALSSGDGRYQGAAAADLLVQITENECGAWGYLAGDLNFDCRVDLEDLSMLAGGWAPSMEGLADVAGDWLGTTEPFAPGAVYGAE